ncbi:hypothetical protein BDI4_300022 [Burkholderia diffusa]|nr:hypothetical protein BDI4_300022 [Burkholderia diffusa]
MADGLIIKLKAAWNHFVLNSGSDTVFQRIESGANIGSVRNSRGKSANSRLDPHVHPDKAPKHTAEPLKSSRPPPDGGNNRSAPASCAGCPGLTPFM